MITMNIKPAFSKAEPIIDGNCRGHITINGRHGLVTSEGQQPDQSMMIFLAVIELMDGIRRFVRQKKPGVYNFVGTDSSFQLGIKNEGEGYFSLISNRKIIDTISKSELIQAVWDGVSQFIADVKGNLPEDDPVSDDLNCAIADFQELLP